MSIHREILNTGHFQRQKTTYSEHCCVPLCTASSKCNGVLSFHGFPNQADLRGQWLVNIRRDNFTISSHTKVCSRHFASDQLIEPTTLGGRRRLVKGAAPTLFEWNGYTVEPAQRDVWERVERPIEAAPLKEEEEHIEITKDHDYCSVPELAAMDMSASAAQDVSNEVEEMRKEVQELREFNLIRTRFDRPVDLLSTISDHVAISSSAHPPDSQCNSVCTQREDLAQCDHDYSKMAGGKKLQDTMTQYEEIGYSMLKNNSDSLLHTGIALEAFNILVSILEGCAKAEFRLTMSVRDQILMTLMKLKNNHVIGDLSRQFNISHRMANEIISHWIDKLEEVLRPLVPWLPKGTIRATMPEAFKKNFPNVTCIVDCRETLLQNPQNLDSRGDSYSRDTHNRVKYLVAVAPCGLIMFISAAYGVRCSDKFMTMDSGILDYLMPGDGVMVEHGCTIQDLLLEREVEVVMPSLAEEDGQLTEEELTCTERTAHVRNHLERATRRLKVYKILSQVKSITMAPKIDKILRICAALINLRAELIHD